MHKPSNTLQQVKEWLEKRSWFPFETMKKWDALYYIQQLEARLAQVERERDAAVNDLSRSCGSCKHKTCTFDVNPCKDCVKVDQFGFIERTHFEWRGVFEENTHDQP